MMDAISCSHHHNNNNQQQSNRMSEITGKRKTPEFEEKENIDTTTQPTGEESEVAVKRAKTDEEGLVPQDSTPTEQTSAGDSTEPPAPAEDKKPVEEQKDEEEETKTPKEGDSGEAQSVETPKANEQSGEKEQSSEVVPVPVEETEQDETTQEY